jgi:DNA-binding transcriptional LysR family regulator
VGFVSADLRHFRYFVAVAEELSFSGAARRLFVSQQALSRVIRQLERELGVGLFERTTRSVALTGAGEAMLVSARRALAAADDAVVAARRAERGLDPRPLRVDISSGGLETGALLLGRLRQRRPDIAVRQVEDGVPRGLAALVNGSLDALLGLASHRPAGLSAEIIRREPVLLGMAARHRLAGRTRIPVEELAGEQLLLPSDEAAVEWNEFVEQFCAQAGVTPRRWPGSTHGSIQAAEVLRTGGCVVPTVAWAQPTDGLVFRPLTEPRPILPWSLMTAAGQHTEELQVLLDCARGLRDNGWPSESERAGLRG